MNAGRASRACGAWAAALACAVAASAAPAAGPGIPPPAIRTLDNGLRVAVFPDSRLGIVQALLLVPAGASADSAGREGVAHLTALLLRHGTSSRDANAFADAVERLGGSLTTTAARDYSTVSGAFLARHFEAGLELMADAVVNAIFPEDRLLALRVQALAHVARFRRNPANLAEEVLWAAVFADHPYGRLPLGTEASLRRVTREDVRAFYRDHYRPDRALLAIAGDVTPDRAFAAVEDWFGRWAGKAPPPVRRPAAAAGPRILVVDAPWSAGTVIRLGAAAPASGDADELAISLASALFGGSERSGLARLESRGEVPPGTGSSSVALLDGGLFSVATTVPTETAAKAVETLRAELRAFRDEPPGEPEVARVRRAAVNAFSMQFETLGAILGYWAAARARDPAGSPFERTARGLEAIDADAVAAAARRWLDPERLAIVAVGPAAALEPQLAALGAVEVIDPAAAEPSPPVAAPAPATPEQEKRAHDVLRRALAAHGGLSRLRRIKDSTVEAEASLWVGDREFKGRFVQIRKEPHKMRFTTSFENVVTEQTLNGDRAWSVVPPAGAQVMDSLGVAGMRTGFASDLPHLLLAAVAPGARPASRGPTRVGSREAEAIELVREDGRIVLHFEAGTHRLAALDMADPDGVGGVAAGRRVYDDYRPVKGILWPHREERYLDGQRVMRLEYRKVLLDSGVDDALFAAPESPSPPLRPPAR